MKRSMFALLSVVICVGTVFAGGQPEPGVSEPTHRVPTPRAESEPDSSPVDVPVTAAGAIETSDGAPDVRFPITVTDRDGFAVTVSEPPRRIVCFSTACIHALAIFDILPIATNRHNITVALDDVAFGDAALDIAELLWTDGYDFEAVLALDPDLVVSFQGAEEWMPIDFLREAVPVYTDSNYAFDESPELEALERQLLDFGLMLGRTARAEAFIARTRDRLRAYDAVTDGTTRLAVVRHIAGEDQFWVPPGCGAALSTLVDCVGTTGEWYLTTSEGILSINPDVVVIEDWGDGVDPAAMTDYLPLWSELDAVAHGRVYLLTPNRTIDYSLFAVAHALDSLIPLAYPALFPDGPLSDEEVQQILAEVGDR